MDRKQAENYLKILARERFPGKEIKELKRGSFVYREKLNRLEYWYEVDKSTRMEYVILDKI